MRTRLYLLTKASPDLAQMLLPRPVPADERTQVILLQDAVHLDPQQLPASEVYVLSEDAVARHVSPPASSLSYGEMLTMIFGADVVVAL
ncbi:hypothetical protein [Nitrospira sp. Kam-Ns4a]